jgi:hypothetical protein
VIRGLPIPFAVAITRISDPSLIETLRHSRERVADCHRGCPRIAPPCSVCATILWFSATLYMSTALLESRSGWGGDFRAVRRFSLVGRRTQTNVRSAGSSCLRVCGCIGWRPSCHLGEHQRDPKRAETSQSSARGSSRRHAVRLPLLCSGGTGPSLLAATARSRFTVAEKHAGTAKISRRMTSLDCRRAPFDFRNAIH